MQKRIGCFMSIFTAAELTTQIAAWKECLLKLATHQEFQMGTRRVLQSDLPEVRKTLEFLTAELSSLTESNGSRRCTTTVVSDTYGNSTKSDWWQS